MVSDVRERLRICHWSSYARSRPFADVNDHRPQWFTDDRGHHYPSVVKKCKRFGLFLVDCAGGFDFLPIFQTPVANER